MPPFRHERAFVRLPARAQRQISLFGVAHLGVAEDALAAHSGGSARVLRGSRGHSACCRPPTSMPVDPALTAL
jgi:hypothetical protein